MKVGWLGGGGLEVGSCPPSPGYKTCTCVSNDLISTIVSQLQYSIYASISHLILNKSEKDRLLITYISRFFFQRLFTHAAMLL